MRSWNGLRTWSKVIRDASSRYAAAPAYVPGMAASFSHRFAVRVPPPLGVGRNHGLLSPYYT